MPAKNISNVVITQNSEEEIPTEIIATHIKAISDGIKKLRSGRLNDKALFLLIQNAAPSIGGKYSTQKVSITEIRAVFQGLESLEDTYLKNK